MTESVTLNRRQLAKQRTADKVLTAARGFFETAGYEKATIRAIAKAAGMSTGAVFANYQDKAEIYAAAFGHPPITPEVGRSALRALQAMVLADSLDQAADSPAQGRAQRFARDVLELARFPALAVPTDPNADDADDGARFADQAVQRYLEGIPINPGSGFSRYVQGQDGEHIDVTAVGE